MSSVVMGNGGDLPGAEQESLVLNDFHALRDASHDLSSRAGVPCTATLLAV